MSDEQKLIFGMRRGFALVLGSILLILMVLAEVLPSGHRPSKPYLAAMASNLRQIDVAKHQWVIQNAATGTVQLTERDIMPFLGRSIISVAGEGYFINSLSVPPEAQLTSGLGRLPEGAVLRLRSDGHGIDIILPKDATGRGREAARPQPK